MQTKHAPEREGLTSGPLSIRYCLGHCWWQWNQVQPVEVNESQIEPQLFISDQNWNEVYRIGYLPT